MLRIY